MSELISVVVGDDHPVVREGLVRILAAATDIKVAGEAGDGPALLRLVREHRPRVALSDFNMPGMDGAQVAAVVRREQLPTRVLVLSAYTEPAMVYAAMQAGASGFLSKEAPQQDILQGIRQVAAGKDVLPPDLASGLFEQIRVRRDADLPVLSGRELQVLTCIAAGKSTLVMAAEMFLAPSTVKTHTQRLYDKLGVSDRGAAVAEGMRRHLLE